MIAALLLLAGCPGEPVDSGVPGDTADTEDTSAPDPEGVTLDGTCAPADAWGRFQVDASEDYAYAVGVVSSGVVPASVQTNVLTTGECTIWRRENPFCDPGCDPGYVCDFDGACIPYPAEQDVGIVTIDGLLQDVAMEAQGPGADYFDTSLPNPPWEPGALVELVTGGGVYEPITLHGYAPDTLVAHSLDWVLVEGEAFALTWDAPVANDATEVVLSVRIDQHGVTPSNIECVFADDGAGEVPADVLGELMGYGISGFPEGALVRRTADRAPIGEGCADLLLTSSRLASVSVSGYTPCTRDDQCPEGLTCNEAMERCE